MYDRNLLARLLLTVVCLGYGVGLILADLNRTHATNPAWTPHARFHVVWQVFGYTALAIIALGLVWTPGPQYVEQLYLACALACTVFIPFFGSVAALKTFGGELNDPNGVQPVRLPLPAGGLLVDKNVMVFSILVVFLIAGFFSISSGGPRP